MPSTVSRAEVERLHRLMIEASIELAQLDARVEAARSEELLSPELQPWTEAAQALDDALLQARGALVDAGVGGETIDAVRGQIASLQARLSAFDLEFDLDDCASAWEAIGEQIARLARSEGDPLLRLLRELQPAVDEAVGKLFDDRREGFLDRQRRVVSGLEKQRQAARERFEQLRQAWLEALRALEEAAEAVVVAPAPAEEEPDAEPSPAVVLPLPPRRDPALVLPQPIETSPSPAPDESQMEVPPLPGPPPEVEVPSTAEEEAVAQEPQGEMPPAPEPTRIERELPLPAPPEFIRLRKREELTPAQIRYVETPEARDPEPEVRKAPAPEEPDLPPPPGFVKAREPEAPKSAAPKPIVVKVPPLPRPPGPKSEARPAPLPPPPRPKREAKPPPPPPPPPAVAPVAVPKIVSPETGIVVERIERAGPFPPGEDGIGRGGQSATIWFRGARDADIPVVGTIGVGLGCATRLDVMPGVEFLAAVPGQPRRGKLSLLLISTGGQLSVSPERARAAARPAAATAATAVAARLGEIGRAVQQAIREVLEDAAGKVFARALPSAGDRGELALERVVARDLSRHHAITDRLERMLARLARRRALLLARKAGEPGPAAEPAHPAPPRKAPEATAEAAHTILLERASAGPSRPLATDISDDPLDLDPAAPDTWIGSGEGARLFSDVFGGFLPAEVAGRERPHPRHERGDHPREQAGGGFFAKVFEDLERFADEVGGWAKKSSRLLGKGMHDAETGMHHLAQVESAAGHVGAFASGAERFLEKLGLDGLAGIAAKASEAARWVDARARLVHGEWKDADRRAGQAKERIDEVEHGASAAAFAFHEAGRGERRPLVDLFEEVAAGAEEGAPLLDEPRRLDLLTLSRMEEFLGGDLSGVRVHTGPAAAEVTRRFDAEAVTVRDHVFFAPGRFRPTTLEGQQLIAHELTHVLQEGRRDLDVRAAETEALRAEHEYRRAPHMETLSLRRPEPDFRLASEEEPAAARATVQAAKRTRSRGQEVGSKDEPVDGEEFLEQVSGRVYELLMEELEQGFDSR